MFLLFFCFALLVCCIFPLSFSIFLLPFRVLFVLFRSCFFFFFYQQLCQSPFSFFFSPASSSLSDLSIPCWYCWSLMHQIVYVVESPRPNQEHKDNERMKHISLEKCISHFILEKNRQFVVSLRDINRWRDMYSERGLLLVQ